MKPISKFKLTTLAALIAISTSGCNMVWPRWGPQGTHDVQRGRAVLHDPFPNNDMGPAVMGGRPLGYERPLAETENSQEYSPRGGRVPANQGF